MGRVTFPPLFNRNFRTLCRMRWHVFCSIVLKNPLYMKKIYFFIAALFAALTLNAQVGFDYRNGGLGDAIKGGELIENETNITITESSEGKYEIKVTSGSYNETGECSFEIGGITFWYKNSGDTTTA